MFRRLFWFVLGALAALFGYGWLRRQADQLATKESVDQFIDGLVDRVTAVKEKVSDTVGGATSGKRDSASDDLFE
ncbi:MAG: hypothetical protein ACKO97_10115 [Actinomycetota bacterium]|jgi:hypothetical protein|nr:hypothetical protein [Actinomycetota bacterium]MBM3816865.1 hypothetical protein [Actinomycetota bacterium]